jgi:hypothetical protein
MSKKVAKKNQTEEDSIFAEIEADLPEDTSELMFDGRRFESHGGSRSYLDDDGR